MGIIMGALGGAGDFLAGAMQQRVKTLDAMDLETHRSELETQKARALADYQETKTIAQEQRAEAPLKRFGGIVGQAGNSEVPMTAAPVTSLSGQGTTFDGQPITNTPGLQGDPVKLRAMANAMPDGEDKRNILKQLDNQMTTDTKAAQDAVAGKTRKPTSDEAVQMAREAALVNDPVALAAYEKSIGKATRDDRRLDLQDKKNDTYQEFQVRRADRLDALQALKEAHEQARQDRLDGKIDASQEKAELNSRRSATIELMKSTEHELERSMSMAKDTTLDPAMAKTYQTRVERLTGDLARYKTALETFSGDAVQPREAAHEPAVKYDAQGRAYVKGPDGKPMPKADAEAKPTASVTQASAPPSLPAEPSRFFGAGGAKAPMFEYGEGPRATASPQAQALFDAVGNDPAKAALLRSDIRKFNLLTPTQRQQIMQLATNGG